MRLVIDLQVAQCDRSRRGTGAYSRSLALALAAEAGQHEVLVALNGAYPEATAELRDAFAQVLPAAHLKLWHGPGAQTAGLDADAPRRAAAERIRAGFLASLKPDLLLVSSVLQGFGTDAVTSVPPDLNGPPTVSLCHNLAPLLHPDVHGGDPARRRFHGRALLDLQHSAGLLAVSAASQAEIVAALGLPADRVASILAGVGPEFREAAEADEPQVAILARYGLAAGMVLCHVASAQPTHLKELIGAYAMLAPALRQAHPLVITGLHGLIPPLRRAVAEAGLADDEVRLLATIPDSDLPGLYRASAVMVIPSPQEDSGLSVAEAMACGATVLCADAGSLPEVIGRQDATFDPLNPGTIAERLRAVLERPAFREELRQHGRARSGLFTWPLTARRAWDALERFAPAAGSRPRARPRSPW